MKKIENDGRELTDKKLDKDIPENWSWISKTFKNWVSVFVPRRRRLKISNCFLIFGSGWKNLQNLHTLTVAAVSFRKKTVAAEPQPLGLHF